MAKEREITQPRKAKKIQDIAERLAIMPPEHWLTVDDYLRENAIQTLMELGADQFRLEGFDDNYLFILCGLFGEPKIPGFYFMWDFDAVDENGDLINREDDEEA